MLGDKKIKKKLIMQLNKLNYILENNRILELLELVGNFKKIIIRNFFSGIFKGIGFGIGFSIISAIIIYVMKEIIRLNIPIISNYILDIIEIIEKNKY